ncbi:MAG TPA: 50S ribosomal protein L18 [Candidatus Eisenbacteria bacterium]|nr:50S ribosomal protein L18 [Candidatus Eisenbacteria bacterium]
MARNARYCTKFRRRREGKTDYKARKALIISGRPRLVTRVSINNVIAQVIVAKPKGDEVLVSAHSRELGKFGWKAPRGNLPAAYLTGYLCGLKAKAAGVQEAIFDIGLYAPTKGARIFAVLKGVLDAKVTVPHSEDKLPDEKRLRGEHIATYAQNLASEPEEYRQKFSKYLQQDVKPETLPKHLAQVKSDMLAAFKNRGK